ncbi:MAG: hypothetical protein NWR72_10270 [Bacteroidia bacterium]|nr:hypothetical protein [Bacteroidia bacterium]
MTASCSALHISRPRNPLIADALFRAGYLDLWGYGTLKIFKACQEAGLPAPEFKEAFGGMMVVLYQKVTPQVTPQVKQLLQVLEGELSRSDLQERLSLADKKNFSENYLKPAIEGGYVEMTTPNKPRSSKQSYRLTPTGDHIKKQQDNPPGI